VAIEHSTCTGRAGPLLDHLARVSRARAESVLLPLGLRPRHLIALTVLRDHGAITQQAFAGALQIDRTNLVGLLNDLERDGLVARTRSAQDRRRHLVALTEAGVERLAEADTALIAVEDEVFGALDAEQRHTLYTLLQRATTGHMVDCGAAAADGDC
jgi:DNA-binding MarR family transcriptional regulator